MPLIPPVSFRKVVSCSLLACGVRGSPWQLSFASLRGPGFSLDSLGCVILAPSSQHSIPVLTLGSDPLSLSLHTHLPFHSLQLVYKLIRAACRKGMRYRKISYDPTAYIDPVEHFPQMREYWSTEEAKTFLRATEGTEMHIIWLLMLGLGLRRGEVCGLRWRDVDLKRGKIHVCNQVYRIDGQLIDGPPKSRTSDRVIVIPELIRKELTEYRKMRLTSRYVYDNTPERLRREFRIAVAGAQLRPISLHGLRHTFAAIAVESGESLKVIQYVLGHADYRVTEKVYAHVSENAVKGAVNGVSGALHSDS